MRSETEIEKGGPPPKETFVPEPPEDRSQLLGRPGSCVAWVRDGIAWVRLDRPSKRNALNVETWQAIGEIGSRLVDSPEVRVAVVYGEGPTFCAGLDLSSMATMVSGVQGTQGAQSTHSARGAQATQPGQASGLPSSASESDGGAKNSSPLPTRGGAESAGIAEGIAERIASLQQSFAWLIDIPVPTVAAVRGHALGAGFQLALCCDIVLAEEGTVFGMLETNYGLVPDMGGTGRLVRSAGLAKAKYLTLTGKRISAEEAASAGLVAAVVPSGTVLIRAQEMASELAMRSRTALAEAKRLLESAFVSDQADSFRAEASAQARCITSPDFAKAVAAQFSRRAADPERDSKAGPAEPSS